MIYWFERESRPLKRTLDKKEIEDILSFGCNSVDCSSLTWLLTLEIMPRSWLYCHNISMLYVLETSSKSWTDLLCLIWVLFEPFLYLSQSFCSPSLFHLISILEALKLICCCALDFSSSQSPSSNLPSSSKSQSVSFVLLFQNQIPDSPSVSLISSVLSLSSSVWAAPSWKVS